MTEDTIRKIAHSLIYLNDYQISNLRWCLRTIMNGVAAGKNLNTGDWCGEICWMLEQTMKDRGITHVPNDPDNPWPLQGWYEGQDLTYNPEQPAILTLKANRRHLQSEREPECDNYNCKQGEKYGHGPRCAECGACQWHTRHDPFAGGHMFKWPAGEPEGLREVAIEVIRTGQRFFELLNERGWTDGHARQAFGGAFDKLARLVLTEREPQTKETSR